MRGAHAPFPPLGELARLLRHGAVTARAVAEGALAASRLGAYREQRPRVTLAQADQIDSRLRAGSDPGPLLGIPISVKDLFGVPGLTTCAGSPRRLPPSFEEPGPVVRALLQGGACVTGKTHTVEFAFGGLGTNPHYRTPINPWDAVAPRAPGGSSAGAGVSLCEGSALLALGTDTAGSVRIPAAWTGNVGLKTSRGRWSTKGVVPLSSTLDTVGLLARSVEDLLPGFAVIDAAHGKRPLPGALPDLEAPPDLAEIRLARVDGLLLEGCSAGVLEAVEEGMKELTGAGVALCSLRLPQIDAAYQLFLRGGPVAPEAARFLAAKLPRWLPSLDPNVRVRLGDAARLPEEEYRARLAELFELASSVDEALEGVDALVAPTVASTPPLLADIRDPGDYGRENLLCLRNTCVANYLGLCAITLPVGLDAASMPVGLMLMARGGQDARLLRLALALERRLGTGGRRLGTPEGAGGRPEGGRLRGTSSPGDLSP